jgi:creatinine amidohydrolase/Fe(II)-dependent formamide hydrolase-like protein
MEMEDKMSEELRFFTTENPTVFFEDTAVGRLKKEVWEASDEEIDAILVEYGMPSPCEWAKPGSYIQTTVRHDLVEQRRKNDIVIIPVGSTELHGDHTVSATDTLFVSQIAEGVRRYFVKQGRPPALALPPLMYGSHPYHHIGMAGTVIIRDHIAVEFMVDVMLGLWNDGFRKQIILNNHGQLWVLEEALHEFCKRYQVPGIYRVIDWHRAVREFFNTKEEGGRWETNFVHAGNVIGSIPLPRNGQDGIRCGHRRGILPAGRSPGQVRRSVPPAMPLVGGRGARRHRDRWDARRRCRQTDPRRPLQGQTAAGRHLALSDPAH